jgi:glutamate racemase
MKNHQPIGIFDSGIGGLTVAQSLVKLLPKENIIYFGDTAHLPYGDKSAETIRGYSLKIAQILLEQNCKLILIACNSASAAAHEAVKQFVASKAIVVDVIDPTIDLLRESYGNKRVGLIGTRQTVHSNVYQKKLDESKHSINLMSVPTNLLAAAIEEFGNHTLLEPLLEKYLSHPTFKNLDALVLACTHYPVIKEKISKFFDHKIEIIDSSDAVARVVKHRLEKDNLLNLDGPGKKHFYVSDFTDSFAASTKIFFDENITLEHYPFQEK